MEYTIKPLYLGKFAAHEKSVFTFRTDFGVKVESPTLCFLIQGGGENIIFDAGPENPELAKRLKRPNEFCDARFMADEPGKHGLAPAHIKTMVVSHLPWDNCSNVELFTNAQIYVQRRELAYAIDPLPIDRSPYNVRFGYGEPLWFAGFMNMKVIDGDFTLADGLDIVTLPGHSPGLQGLLVNTREGKYLIASDHIPLYENYEKGIPSGIHTNLDEWYASLAKARRLCDAIIPGHDMRVMEREVYGA